MTRRLRSHARNITVFVWLAVIGGLIVQRFIAERTVPTLLLTYGPQAPWLVLPAMGFVVALLALRPRLMLANLVLAVVVLFGLMGFNIPRRVPKGRPDLTVVTWNICAGLSDHAAVARHLARMDADVIILQEAREVPLEGHLADYERAVGRNILILSRLPMRRRQEMVLGSPHFRNALWVSVTCQGRTIDVLGVHFSVLATGGSLRATLSQPRAAREDYLRKTAEARRIEADAVLRWARARRNPVIIAGDFNTPPNCMVYRSLRSYADDAFATAGWGRGLTYSQRRPLWRIDYIFTRGLTAVAAEAKSAPTSDHRLLLSRLRFD